MLRRPVRQRSPARISVPHSGWPSWALRLSNLSTRCSSLQHAAPNWESETRPVFAAFESTNRSTRRFATSRPVVTSSGARRCRDRANTLVRFHGERQTRVPPKTRLLEIGANRRCLLCTAPDSRETREEAVCRATMCVPSSPSRTRRRTPERRPASLKTHPHPVAAESIRAATGNGWATHRRKDCGESPVNPRIASRPAQRRP